LAEISIRGFLSTAAKKHNLKIDPQDRGGVGQIKK
jgi:hypothetical protein